MNRNGHNGASRKNSDLPTNIVIGMSDGLIVPFALTAGISSIVDSNQTVITAGVTCIILGSLVMSVGGYLAGKTRIAHHKKPLKGDNSVTKDIPEMEKQEVKAFFANIGLSEDMQARAAEEMSNDKRQWSELITKYELSPGKAAPAAAVQSALTIGVSYAVGGLIPLSPYFFATTPWEGLKVSAILTITCLFLFGYFKNRITGLNPLSGAIRTSLTGALAAAAAFGAAKLFEL